MRLALRRVHMSLVHGDGAWSSTKLSITPGAIRLPLFLDASYADGIGTSVHLWTLTEGKTRWILCFSNILDTNSLIC
jgi:hypothetical protein